MNSIAHNLEKIRQRMRQAALAVGRDPQRVNLLAVSKTRSIEEIQQAMNSGQKHFGENYLQDAEKKIHKLGSDAVWHFIGPLQSNKTRMIAEDFDWVHSVNRIKIARRLNEQRPEPLAPLNVCLQVNTSNELSKSGLTPEAVLALAQEIQTLPRLRLRGLMTIPAAEKDTEKQKVPFRLLRELLRELNTSGLNLDTLSMGMSNDFESAIAEGATIVRIGTAIFGPRR